MQPYAAEHFSYMVMHYLMFSILLLTDVFRILYNWILKHDQPPRSRLHG